MAESGLEFGAVNRSTLSSLLELPADLSACAHYHEKEGNPVPQHPSQWVGISSLVAGNSIFPCFPLFKLFQYIIPNPFLYLLRRSSDAGMVGDQENWKTTSSLNTASPLCFCTKASALPAPSVPASRKQTIFSVPQGSFRFREHPPPTSQGLGHPHLLLLCPFTNLLRPPYECRAFCLVFLYSRMVARNLEHCKC